MYSANNEIAGSFVTHQSTLRRVVIADENGIFFRLISANSRFQGGNGGQEEVEAKDKSGWGCFVSLEDAP